ncbi:MAG: thioredoxin [Symploca sp. SIO3C6]|uniref:Thioredoxin n=1 Tax=Symploca sp. SIO1C4 TaxID=2607765 RepID=A0A6B3NKD2_9CYAN|nr:thioredoxin [Symploca sp. SIO3C6]NER31335.1 thioredoxin [Symploca sp. SIO1C4]
MSDTTKYITLTNDNFETEVKNSTIPVVVDFWAPWCGPCRVMNPVVTELATNFEGIIKVGKVNIDDYEDLATEYRIEAIPALLLFEEGKVVEQLVGVVPKQVLVEKVKALVEQQPLTLEQVV